ncbi:MAG: 4-hydroxyphenylpyruvate dioxygenase [Actinophytocola sp.]|uniref:4-hydroxyphenylpyruvate dioxygenase n=1 Tax=Actinophytocola sp. TaxID=1872138 RepID=UPI0013272BA8|nr:4-hydroxyphenylpyruvate dioxygenase [Actinophytocola sp.]MPZ81294.1 4-hydroxyphenylpyruvate dioxygenase [Actinophytocola sp.]
MRPFDEMSVDHVGFYVDDLAAQTTTLVDSFGFTVSGQADISGEARSVGLGRSEIRLLLTEPVASDHPGSAYLENHGFGAADIAFGVADAADAYHEAVQQGARPVSGPAAHDGVVTATVMGFGDVVHTFVERSGDTDGQAFPWLSPVAEATAGRDTGLSGVDHFAICVEAGQLDPMVEFYERVFDFETIFTERIVVGAQAMDSKVVQSASGAVTFTILEPDVSHVPGQIDQFLKNHGGSGVQHVAFITDDIVRSVDSISAQGVAFLSTPDSYYTMLGERLEPAGHSLEDLQRLDILADEDQDGQLFQIFARSTHPRKTFFFEVIERVGARTFGGGNIKALYEAVEVQRSKDGDV